MLMREYVQCIRFVGSDYLEGTSFGTGHMAHTPGIVRFRPEFDAV
jgi:hypothetical protein